MTTPKPIELREFRQQLTHFFQSKRHLSKLATLLTHPETHLSPKKGKLLSRCAHLLIEMQSANPIDTPSIDAFSVLAETFVSAYFPPDSQDNILDLLYAGDNTLYDEIAPLLSKAELNTLKLLVSYSSAIKIERARKSKLTEDAFKSKPMITDSETLSRLIHQKISTLKLLSSKKHLAYSALSSPFFFFNVYRNALSINDQDKLLKDSTPALTGRQIEKAMKLIALSKSLQVAYGKSPIPPTLIYQIAALYPLTDEYLDEPRIPLEKKLSLCSTIQKFARALLRTGQNPIAEFESDLPNQIAPVLSKFDVKDTHLPYNKIWRSLLKLNYWQRLSVMQGKSDLSSLSLHYSLFDLSYEKCAATFELVALLSVPDISDSDLALCRHFGGLFQLLDDCEDLYEDIDSNILSYTANFILPSTQWIDTDELHERLEQTIDKTIRRSTAIKQNAFVSLLFHHFIDVFDEMSKGKWHLSKVIIDEVYLSILKTLLQCVQDTPVETHTQETATSPS